MKNFKSNTLVLTHPNSVAALTWPTYIGVVLLIDIIIWTRCQNKRKGFINDKENPEFKWEEFCYRIHFKCIKYVMKIFVENVTSHCKN